MTAKTTRAQLEDRRRTAVRKVADGRTCADVADFLRLHIETVRRWVREHKAQGDAGLTATPHPGRKPFLTPEQQAEALTWLTRKPSEFGFRIDLWTAARVAQLIRERFGVAYHPSYLREWLTKRRHSPQKPAQRAKQQQPAVLESWLDEDYPAIKKKSPPSTRILS